MKKLITVIAIALLASCNQPQQKHCTYKYKKGDIVYLKLDHTKVMIARQVLVLDDQPTYEIYFKSSSGSYGSDYIEEFCLTDKNK